MDTKFIGPKAEMLLDADSGDFIGSTRQRVTLEAGITSVAVLPKKFGWNTLVVAADGNVRVQATISSMKDIKNGNAIWINLEDCPGDLPKVGSFAGGVINSVSGATLMFAWEHPIVAFGFSGAAGTEVRFEVSSKHD